MKLTIVLLTVVLVQVQAAVVAQTVSLTGKNIPVKKVLQTIKQQTGYVTFYNQDMLSAARPVTLDVDKLPLDEVLALISKDQPFRFEVKEATKTIMLSPRAPAAVVGGNGNVIDAVVFKNVSGRVTDSTDNSPMPGASVRIQGKQRSVSTDAQGRFQIDAEPGDVLVITYVGYRPTYYTVRSDGRAANISMAPAISTMNNVVVTGIFNKPQESYTGAAKVITAKELQRFQGRNIFVTIGNIDPAFYIAPNNAAGSDPNQLPDVQLRGTRNLPNIDQLQDNTSAALNTPLIILDGFPTTLQRMMDLNNNQIESITLLKDGSATALYGSRGANGVIVITTKPPSGGRLQLTYRGGLNLSMPDLSSYDLLNAREKLELERVSGFYASATKDPLANIGLQQYYNAIKEKVEGGLNTDWISKPLRTEVDQNHSIRLDGGENAFRYALEGQYNRINGAMKGSKRETLNATMDITYRMPKLNFRNNLIVGNMKGTQSPWGSFSDYVKLNPYWSPYEANGQVAKTFNPFNWDYWTQVSGHGTTPYPNPMYDATLNTFNKSGYNSITNNFQVEWLPVKNLSIRGGLGINTQDNNADIFKPASHSSFAGYSEADIIRKGSYEYASGKQSAYSANLTANYFNTFKGGHTLTLGASLDMNEEKRHEYRFMAEGFPDESINFLGMALQYASGGKPKGTEATTRRIGVVGNVNYAYRERYFADLAYRMDGASQFGLDKRFAPFWSAGLGWNVHSEAFMQPYLHAINRLRVRGSYGVTGNQAFSAYQALATYSYIVDNHYKNWLGATQTTLGNPNLQWQKTGKSNIGIESEWFKSRIILQADVYKEKTSNLLSSLELPYSNGFTSYVENIGKLDQVGFELMASVVLIRNTAKRLNWSVTGNVTHNRDQIVALSNAMKAANDKLALLTNGNSPNRIIREGASQNTIYAVRSLGIDPSTGKELFLTKDGDVTYLWNPADRVATGLSQPKYRGNFSSLFRYGNFSANASFGYRFGGQLYNQTLIDKIENADKMFNVDARVFYDRWKQPGDRTFFRGINEVVYSYPSSRFVQDERTLVCQNVNLSYDVYGRAWQDRIGMKSLTITVNTGELFYTSSVRQERGLDFPFTRQVSLNVFAIF
ncbi:SusC/RagA family TonB-linked outer membrane protein [Chitinophaga horti]|uniref:SusC/RagA family TonB-linked outer membrane protein n=1 Tax=Chitinophaga horti TaxID=2920382 RepID=A0ABY6IUW4_9BACT|nr:SusC/RagA family TonB-linked outer membrane protein [Chitinophaga horti]UYQ91167.1 SusC/RagA family TonB-linked outer membrane protein [Chitinophaga horti]